MKKISALILSTLITIIFNQQIIGQTTAEVGTLPGSFGVSPSGAATYVIPIDLPPGRAGMTPELSFAYNNHAPSTIMGLGWGISGFSAIGRSNPTLYFNGEVDNVDFIDDQLTLDGNRLIEIGTEGGNIIYRTELDGISKVVYHPTGGYDNKEYFIVHTKGGMKKEYGLTNNSRQTYPDDNTEPLFWHLNKIIDQQGNYVEYNYAKDYELGELHPLQIEYTLFEDGTGTESSYFIEFDYALLDTNMYQTFYFEYIPEGNEEAEAYINKNTHKLVGMSVKTTDDDKTVATYDLMYKTETLLAGEYCLDSIIYSASGDGGQTIKSFKPTTFEWNYYNPSRHQKTTDFKFTGDAGFKPQFKNHKLGRMDLYGSGKDVVVDYREEFDSEPYDPIRKIKVQDFNNSELDITVFEEMGMGSRAESLSGVDFDNDGKDELLVGMTDEVWIYKFAFNGSNWSVGDSLVISENGDWLTPFAGDFTGDGIPDLLIVNESEAEAKLRIGTGDVTDFETSQVFTFTDVDWLDDNDLQDITTVADFNGDGKTDILLEIRENVYTGGGSEIAEVYFDLEVHSFNGSGFDQIALLEFENDDAETYDKNNIIYADFNGDGRTDVNYQKYSITYYEEYTSLNEVDVIYHSFGKGFVYGKTYTSSDSRRGMLFNSDQNNDGRADKVYVKMGIETEPGHEHEDEQFISTTTYFTNPDGLAELSNVQKTYLQDDFGQPVYQYEIVSILFADLSGNCINDLVVSFCTKGEEIPDPATDFEPDYKWEYTINAFVDNVQPAANVIVGATNGFGMESKISYQPSRYSFTGPGSYTYPFGLNKSKTWLVRETYIVGENDNKLNQLIYTFKTPLMMLRGKGFMGFEKITVSDYQQNVQTFTNYKIHTEVRDDKDMYFVHYPDSIVVTELLGTGQELSITKNHIAILNTVTGNDFPFIPVTVSSSTSRWDNDKNHSLIKTVTTTQNLTDVDQYGNSVKKTIVTSDENEEFETAIEKQYIYYVPGWVLDRVTQTKFTKNYQSGSDVKQFDYLYYQPNEQGFPLLKTKTMLPNNNTALKTQLLYLYDDYGNVIEKTLSAPNANPPLSSRVTNYVYDTGNGYDARFLTEATKTIDANDYTSSFTYDTKTGNVNTTTNPAGLLTSNTYDAMGRLQQSLYADGTTGTVDIGWADEQQGLAPPDALYFTSSESSGNAPVYNFFDKYQRNLRQVTYGLEYDKIIYSDKEYYQTDGRLLKAYEPYFSTGSANLATEYIYGELGRLRIKKTPANSFGYFYQGRLSEFTNNGIGILKATTVNAMGKTVSVTDPTGTITYTYYSNRKVKSIDALGALTTMQYDDAGNQILLDEPNAGQTQYIYNAYGELIEQTDARQNKYNMAYDNFGRLILKTLASTGEQTVYEYNNVPDAQLQGRGFGKIKNVIASNNIAYSYEYDDMNRLLSKTEMIEGQNYAEQYTYNHNGKLDTYTYPSGFSLTYDYYKAGNLMIVTENEQDNIIWRATGKNERQQLTDFNLGNGLSTHLAYNAYGFNTNIYTHTVQDLEYQFDSVTGNLSWRKDHSINKTETFGYDDLLHTRLISWQVAGQQAYTAAYQNNGNINTKTDVTLLNEPNSIYQYGSHAGPHALTSIESPTTEYNTAVEPIQNITYTAFNKVEQISQTHIVDPETGDEAVYAIDFTYGPDNFRKKARHTLDRGLLKTKYYVGGNYEIEVDDGGNQTKLHYLSAGNGIFAIYKWNTEGTQTNKQMDYIHTDHLGSYETVSNANGDVVDKVSFDPWGRPRNPINWSYEEFPLEHLFDRGYTGHEHHDIFELINMNGRVYDPWLGRMLSPDIIVQSPGNSQSYNRYSYVFNNPLKFVDPSGYYSGPSKDLANGNVEGMVGGMNFFIGQRGQVITNFNTFGNSGFNIGYSTETKTTGVYDDDGNRIGFTTEQQLVEKDGKGGKKVINTDGTDSEQEDVEEESAEEEEFKEAQNEGELTSKELSNDFADSFNEIIIEGYVDNLEYEPDGSEQVLEDLLYSDDLISEEHAFVLSPLEVVLSTTNGQMTSQKKGFADPYWGDPRGVNVYDPGYETPISINRNGVTYIFVIKYQIRYHF